MTSQLRQNFHASQPVLMTSQLRTFIARSDLLALVVPKLLLLFAREGLSAQPFSINFDKS